jgi:hypothetical protein
MSDITNKKAKQITAFGGINQNKAINDNELTVSVNMSDENYPLLSVAKSFEPTSTTNMTINGACDYNGMFYTAIDKKSGNLYAYHNGNSILIAENATDGKRFFAGMSDNILIMPDQIVYNVSSNSAKKLTDSQHFNVENAIDRAYKEMPGISSTIPKGVARITSSRIETNLLTYGVYTSYMMCPQNLNVGDFVFVKMNITTGSSEDDKKYADLISNLKKGVYVKITRLYTATHFIYAKDFEDVYAIQFEGAINIDDNDDMYVTDITIEKRIPDLSHICTYGNRIWGVEKNSIRCSLLGDGTVWEDFSSDTFGTLPSSCFSLEVDTGGEFTAICEYNGNILAFKENCVHKIYGSKPENYTLNTQSLKGVRKGAGNTLVNINGVLYYMGIDGFYKYGGGVPLCISQKLDNNFTAIFSATDGTTYYTIVDRCGKKEILTYDTIREIWHTLSADNGNILLYSDNGINLINDYTIQKLIKSSDDTRWEFEMEFDENTFCQKRYFRFLLDYSLKKNGYFTVTAIFDDNPSLNYICGDYHTGDNAFTTITLPFVRCNKIKLLFKGKGDFMLKKLTREFILLKEGGK